MDFATALKSFSNLKFGEKGALEHNTSNDAIIDLYLKLSKTTHNSEVNSLIDACLQSNSYTKRDILNIVITLLYKRTPRGGEGVRDTPIRCLVYLYTKVSEYKDEIEQVILELPEYGRFNDYWRVIDIINESEPTTNKKSYFEKYNKLVQRMTENYITILKNDEKIVSEWEKNKDKEPSAKKKSISWAAKYFPRPKGREDTEIYWYYGIYKETSMVQSPVEKTKKELFKLFKLSLSYYITHMFYNKKVFEQIEYPVGKKDRLPDASNQKNMRKLYGKLSRYLNVPEINMSEENWADINFKMVPSICRFKFSDAFQNKLKKKKKYDYFDEETGDRYPYNDDRIECRKNFIDYILNTQLKNCKNYPVDIHIKHIKSSNYDTTNEKSRKNVGIYN